MTWSYKYLCVCVHAHTRMHAQMFQVLGVYLQSMSRLSICNILITTNVERGSISPKKSAFSLEGINS